MTWWTEEVNLITVSLQEYIRLYKKKFNGPQSSFHWRRSLPPLTAEARSEKSRTEPKQLHIELGSPRRLLKFERFSILRPSLCLFHTLLQIAPWKTAVNLRQTARMPLAWASSNSHTLRRSWWTSGGGHWLEVFFCCFSRRFWYFS